MYIVRTIYHFKFLYWLIVQFSPRMDAYDPCGLTRCLTLAHHHHQVIPRNVHDNTICGTRIDFFNASDSKGVPSTILLQLVFAPFHSVYVILHLTDLIRGDRRSFLQGRRSVTQF